MATINQVPLEILEDIVSRAVTSRISVAGPVIMVKPSIGQLAAVNSKWQQIVEKNTFQVLVLTADDIPTAMKILQNRPERFSLVRQIVFQVKLPSYGPLACTMLESPRERFQNDIVFTKSMNILLKHLSEWPITGKTLELQLHPFSESDARYLKDGQWKRSFFGPIPGDILSLRMYGSTIELYRRPDKLVPAVTRFMVSDNCERYLAVSAFNRLLEAFPGLKDVDIRYWDIYKNNRDSVRRTLRRNMAKALDVMPAGVGSMRFHLEYHPPADQRKAGQKTRDENGGSDALTVSFRNASQKMTIVDVHGMLWTPELFWPKQVSTTSPEPSWPNLKYMELYYHIIGPNGKWVFEEDAHSEPRIQAELPTYDLPANDTAAEDFRPMQNRYTAKQDKMNMFYTTVCKAVSKMPKLEHLRLQALTYWKGRTAPFHVFEYNITGRVAHATWYGIPPFKPNVDVLNAWKMLAYDNNISIHFDWKEKEIETDTECDY